MRRLFVLLCAGILPAIPVSAPGQTPGPAAPAPQTAPTQAPGPFTVPAPAWPQATRGHAGGAPRYPAVQIPVYQAHSPEAAEAMREFSELEAKSMELARQIRSLGPAAGDEEKAKQRDDLRAQLSKAVQVAFEARQKVQQIEVDQLKKRLAAVEETLQKRESKKDQIIGSRLDELLDENRELRWDPAGAAGYGFRTATVYQAPTFDPSAKAPPADSPPAVGPVRPLGAAGFPPTAPPRQNTPPGSVPPKAATPARQPNGASANETFLRQHPLLMPELAQTREDLINVAAALEKAQREVEQLTKTSQDENAVRDAQKRLALADRHMERIRMEYETQLRLLELQADSAKTRLMDAERDYQRVKQLGGNVVTQQEIEKRQSELALANNELEKVTILLELHRSAVKTDPSTSTPEKVSR